MKLSARFIFAAVALSLPGVLAYFAREAAAVFRDEPSSLFDAAIAFWICAGVAWCWEAWRARRNKTTVAVKGEIVDWDDDGERLNINVRMPDGSERLVPFDIGGEVTITARARA